MFYVPPNTFKAARRWQLGVSQQIHAEHLHVWLTVGRVDARTEVVSRAQGPAARVLTQVVKGRRSTEKTGQFIVLTKSDKYGIKKEMKRSPIAMNYLIMVECE